MRVKPDLITVWPTNCDYPLWRQQIRNTREHFADVIIVFMNPNQGSDLRDFIKWAMEEDQIKFLDSPKVHGGQDWRNVATRFALEHSHNDWIWFTEQDFFTTKQFWLEVNKYVKEQHKAIAIKEGDRVHPASILIKREIVDLTRKNFSVVPEHDHFYAFVMDVIEKYGDFKIVKGGYTHMNGLSHNMTLLQRGEPITYKPEELKEYLEKCIKLDVPISVYFRELSDSFINRKSAENA